MRGLERIKKGAVFLLILAMLAAGAALAAWGKVSECVSVLTGRPGPEEYSLISADADGCIFALGRRDGRYLVVHGDETGKRRDRVSIKDGVLPEESIPASFYPASDGSYYIGLYDTSGDTAELKLYRTAGDGNSAELLLSETGAGGSLGEQMASVRLSEITSADGMVCFAVIRDGEASFYKSGTQGGIVKTGTAQYPGLRCAMALPGDVWVLVTDSGMIRTDRREPTDVNTNI